MKRYKINITLREFKNPEHPLLIVGKCALRFEKWPNKADVEAAILPSALTGELRLLPYEEQLQIAQRCLSFFQKYGMQERAFEVSDCGMVADEGYITYSLGDKGFCGPD